MSKFNSKPKIVVCVPTFNSEKTIKKTVNSILKQSYKNFDVFFFDNFSKDNTHKIIKYYLSNFNNFKSFIARKNFTAEENFNKILEKTRYYGKYFCIFHSDDIYHKDILKFSINFLEKNPDCGAVSSNANIIDVNDRLIRERALPEKIKNKLYIKLSQNIFLDLLFNNNNFLVTPSFVFRTKSFLKYNYFFKHKDFKTASDLNLWIDILKKEKIGIINKILINYRLSKYSHTFRNINLQISDSDLFKVLNKVLRKVKKHNKLKYNLYKIKYDFWLMKDRCNQLINIKLLGNKKKISLGIINNIKYSLRCKKNFFLIIYVIFIKSLSFLPFSKYYFRIILKIKKFFFGL
jgi:glycosyltransferase involved in cell wall biosynthesis